MDVVQFLLYSVNYALFHDFVSAELVRTSFGKKGFVRAPNKEAHQSLTQKDDTLDVKLVLVGMRHGNRNPAKFLPNDPNFGLWGNEGELQLTNYGKRQVYALGRALRSRYSHLIPEQYMPQSVVGVTSSAERAQMTLQTFLNGLFPPVGRSVWNPSLPWQPIPVSISDPMLRMYNVKNCKTGNDAWNPISTDILPGLKDWKHREHDVLHYVMDQTGWKESLSTLADLADNIRNIQTMNLTLPHWIEVPMMPGFNKTSFIDKIFEFREAHQVACANHAPCRNIMAGVWLNDIWSNLVEAENKTAHGLKMIAYASHTEVILSVMKLLRMDYDKVPSSGGFILEYKLKPKPSVRMLYHEPDFDNPDIRYLYASERIKSCPNDWCPLSEVLSDIKRNAISDWKLACRVKDDCPKLASSEPNLVSVSAAATATKRYKDDVQRSYSLDCSLEKDESPSEDCKDWSIANYCEEVPAVKYLFCRFTCLCVERR